MASLLAYFMPPYRDVTVNYNVKMYVRNKTSNHDTTSAGSIVTRPNYAYIKDYAPSYKYTASSTSTTKNSNSGRMVEAPTPGYTSGYAYTVASSRAGSSHEVQGQHSIFCSHGSCQTSIHGDFFCRM